MVKFDSVKFAEKAIAEEKCSEEAKEFLIRALRMQYADPGTAKEDFERLAREIIKSKR